MDDNKLPINICIFKACNFLNHDILLPKLKHYGFTGKVNALLKCLNDQLVFFVVFNRAKTDLISTYTVVLQGSILRPLLFSI